MPAYYVGTIQVTNVEIWQQYVSQVGATIEAYGGEVMFRGTRDSGPLPAVRSGSRLIVVLRFVDEAAASRWHESADYQRLVPVRDAGAEVSLMLYSGAT
ncbi:MAG: DUF1330 domain-containing protein [Betaproteobacteria bacterium]|jgi:uncharacterized protein (DUF1330 family)